MTKPISAEIIVTDEGDILRINVGEKPNCMGVDVRLPCDPITLNTAISVLMGNLAGVAEAQITMAAVEALADV